MIFTIGHEKTYRDAISKNNGPIQKMGRRKPCKEYPNGYEGGCCFKTFKEAQAAIDTYYPRKGYIVWGMETGWENTSPSTEHAWNDLIQDADIVPLVKVSVRKF